MTRLSYSGKRVWAWAKSLILISIAITLIVAFYDGVPGAVVKFLSLMVLCSVVLVFVFIFTLIKGPQASED